MSAYDSPQSLWFQIVTYVQQNPLAWIAALPAYEPPQTNMSLKQPLLFELVRAAQGNY